MYDEGKVKRSNGDGSFRHVGKKSGMASSHMKFQVTILNKIFQGVRDYAPALSAQECSRDFAWFDEQAVPKVRLRKCAKSARFSSDPLMALENGNKQTPNLESETCGCNSKGNSFISLIAGVFHLSAVIYGSSETGKLNCVFKAGEHIKRWVKKALGSIILVGLTFSARPPSFGLFTSWAWQLNLARFNYNGRSETGKASHCQWYFES